MMSVVVILVLLETVRFLIKDKSETLSSKYVCRTKPTPQNYKIFCSGQHSRGYCPANFQKQPVINTIAEKRVFLYCEVTKIVYFIGNEHMLIAHDSNRLRFS